MFRTQFITSFVDFAPSSYQSNRSHEDTLGCIPRDGQLRLLHRLSKTSDGMHVVFVAMSARLALIQKKIKHSKDSLFP